MFTSHQNDGRGFRISLDKSASRKRSVSRQTVPSADFLKSRIIGNLPVAALAVTIRSPFGLAHKLIDIFPSDPPNHATSGDAR
jgi:hypothetical protein